MHLGNPLHITVTGRTNKHTTIIPLWHPMVRRPAERSPKNQITASAHRCTDSPRLPVGDLIDNVSDAESYLAAGDTDPSPGP